MVRRAARSASRPAGSSPAWTPDKRGARAPPHSPRNRQPGRPGADRGHARPLVSTTPGELAAGGERSAGCHLVFSAMMSVSKKLSPAASILPTARPAGATGLASRPIQGRRAAEAVAEYGFHGASGVGNQALTISG